MSVKQVPRSSSRSVATADRVRQPGASLATRHTASSLQKYGTNSANKELKDVLERKIEDLSRQLTQEKQTSRHHKVALSRLQREVTRSKSADRPVKEQLSKELEHEKMIRAEAEHRLQEMTKESDNCRYRLSSLQDEFRKMEDMVQDMVQYKSKIDQLKQEKSSLSSTYETRLDQFQGHVTDLERENMLLLNEVKKLESQMNHKHDGSPDRSKLLLERLRMLEGENSSLVLENEQQRGQYEKCLDEIANQVVQALLAQKMLREECLKLQNRVHDLEHQNRQICTIFQHNMRHPSQKSAEFEAVMMRGSIDSIQSMFSEQMSEHLATVPNTSSTSPWLQERLPGDRHSVTSLPGSVMSTPELDSSPNTSSTSVFSCRTKIETEFPATPSSPKSKHVNVIERQNETKRSSSVSSLTSQTRGPNKQRTRSTSSLSRVRGLSFLSPPERSQSNDSGILNATTNEESVKSSQRSTEKSIDSIVPLNQSTPSISSQSGQGHVPRGGSKIPGIQIKSHMSDENRLRRNSLKAEYGIRMGCHSPVSSKPPTQKVQGQTSRSPSFTSNGSQASSRSPVSSTKSASTSRIPTGLRNSGSNLAKPAKADSKENVSVQNKGKPVVERHISTSKVAATASGQSKLVPPRSPTLRYSGIRTTLKADKTTTSKSENVSKAQNSNIPMTTPATIKSAYAINPSANRQSQDRQARGASKPPIPIRGDKSIGPSRSETHYPIMGLTNLSHTSPKNEDSPKIYANVFSTQNIYSVQRVENPAPSSDHKEMSALKQAQYFYDYSDEDSDVNMTRPVSKAFSIASTVSLDELLDQTLENVETPLDGHFNSDKFLYGLKQVALYNKSSSSNRTSSERDESTALSPTYDIVDGDIRGRVCVNDTGELVRQSANTVTPTGDMLSCEKESRLRGKPDIVKDTEECEQRKLQKTITVSQIPGSSMPGYRAKRPKSLILGDKEKKFLYCEYGSSSSLDSTDEEWSYQLSYAKKVKQQEIRSKVAKSLQSGQAQLIESPAFDKDGHGAKGKKINKVVSENSDKKAGKQNVPKLPKANISKKPSKIPPPVASKPVKKTNMQNGDISAQQKSIEICVNTVLASTESATCYSYLNKSDRKTESVKGLSANVHHSNLYSSKSDDTDFTMNSTFDDVKVERSGSKDDGYSTMSSDVQPEMLEKYSDVFESSTNSNDIRNSNLSLSSQNSFSSEDRPITQGSLGRVRSMKIKLEIENQKSPENEMVSSKTPPHSPAKSVLKPPKPSVLVKPLAIQPTSNISEKNTSIGISRITKSKPVKESAPGTKVRSAIPVSKSSSLPVKKTSKLNINLIPAKTRENTVTPSNETVNESKNMAFETTPVKLKPNDQMSHSSHLPQTSTPKHIDDQFTNLGYFAPTLDHIEFLRDVSGDSNSSLSDRGSDLTSLHISEDNILSDIPEEKEGYESSVGHRSGHTSFSSIPNINMMTKKSSQNAHSVHHSHLLSTKFTTTLKNRWSSLLGLNRAAKDSDYEQQKQLMKTADYEELYGGCLNIETLNERSTSESDLYNRGDKPEVTLFPRLPRSSSAYNLVVDELAVEEQLQAVLKAEMIRQIQKNVDSADKDDANFTSFVELLIQRGHVMDPASSPVTGKGTKVESPGLNKMSVSNLSSKVNTPSVDKFVVSEEKSATDVASQGGSSATSPVGEEQKKFNSQFYSLCNTGSVKSISEKSDQQPNDATKNAAKNSMHTCQKGDSDCAKCIDEKNVNEFDDISRQIESLSKTVNALHKSLTSLNSENSDSGSESNEGEGVLTSAIGNKDIDGYQWVEDEFFLSPYGGEVILGGSPFSDTGASCDWMNEYSENNGHFDEMGGQEGLHEDPIQELSVNKHQLKARKTNQNSILAGALDKEGNFDSKRFISRRLRQEEIRRRTHTGTDTDQLDNAPDIQTFLVTNVSGGRKRSSDQTDLYKKEEHRTQEKEIEQKNAYGVKRTSRTKLGSGGSADSLDDNIGVDNMMCHRLLGGKGPTEAVRSAPFSRTPLDFSTDQFIRFGDLEKEAVAAFDFLNEMASSNMSEQSGEKKVSRDELLVNGGRKSSKIDDKNRMTQSTTSNESRASPIKRNRRKLRPKTRRNQRTNSNGANNNHTFSSTSTDSNLDSDEDVCFSDSFCDSYSSSEEEETVCQSVQARPKTMTYI